MALRVVGAGLGRTGTHSLKVAFEQLLGGPCYHMLEVLGHPDHMPVWAAAVKGDEPDWAAFFSDYVAAVDWPVAAFDSVGQRGVARRHRRALGPREWCGLVEERQPHHFRGDGDAGTSR